MSFLSKAITQAAAGVGGAEENLYIEDVFSTYLYAGNGSTQTITNGIDLDGKGGLVWIKNRDQTDSHVLTDTERGVLQVIASNGDGGSGSLADSVTAFNSNGFSISSADAVNTNTENFVSWTFRKAPKFFDVVTYTGTGARFRTVAHNLGSVPGCIMVKRTDTTGNWIVYHRANTGNPKTDYLVLNSTAATADQPYWEDTAPTDSTFMVNNNAVVNASGGTYLAYLFAHEDGGFGDDGSENIITCGGYTGNGSATGPVITLNYEPQWLLIKRSDSTGNWLLLDTMRGIPTGYVDPVLKPNSNAVESSADDFVSLLSTGFQLITSDNLVNASGGTYIYIAIRRPMKTPTAGTEVFTPITITADAPTATRSQIGFEFDTVLTDLVGGSYGGNSFYVKRISSRLTGLGASASPAVITSANNLEQSFDYHEWDGETFTFGPGWISTKFAWYFFKRAKGFFDVVCYTGDGNAGRTVAHNLGVAPEMIWVKCRSSSLDWYIGHTGFNVDGDSLPWTDVKILFNTLAPIDLINAWNDTAPGSSVFTVGNGSAVNGSGSTYIAYLFASLPGISKVGSYTGTGTTQAIDCGFSTGARFILIKRVDSTGAFYVWDSARGIVAGDDPYLLLGSNTTEVTNTDYIDPSAAGFEISSTAPAEINASGGTFIFLAIA